MSRSPSRPTSGRQRAVLRGLALCLGVLIVAGFAPPAAAQNCPANKTCFYVPPQMPPPPHGVTWDLVLSAGFAPVTGTYTFPGEA
ncbi:MAG TPA: hypothetical protein PK095_15535, partial [Myxococcota bacterium]|nr:hypothetical protein [Myxococcota bacterium]